MKAQDFLGGVLLLLVPWSIHTECSWTPRLAGWQGEGLGKGISHGGERPRGKWPVTFHFQAVRKEELMLGEAGAREESGNS